MRPGRSEHRTNSTLLLSTKRNVVMQYVVLVYPDLTKQNGDCADHRLYGGHFAGLQRGHSRYQPPMLTKRAWLGSHPLFARRPSLLSGATASLKQTSDPLECNPAPRPYEVLLASSIASPSVLNLPTARTGPKIL